MLKAELIFDNAVMELEPVADARHDQDKGTIARRLGERAGRECYDSYGTGRSSELYHEHIAQVGHTSIYEHYNWVVDIRKWLDRTIRGGDFEPLLTLINRPGIWYRDGRLTINARCLIDWKTFGPIDDLYSVLFDSYLSHYDDVPILIEPEHDEERWLTFQVTCSRGCSHELVRHKFRTAVSQRSTRYVNESRSDWCWHPEFEKLSMVTRGEIRAFQGAAQDLYTEIVDELEPESGRKQARGAARGVLGNALSTKLIFSASVAQWKRIVAQRDHVAADREIRDLIHNDIVPVLETL